MNFIRKVERNIKPLIKKKTGLQLSSGPFAAILMFGLPLIMTYGFSNITKTKSVFFYCVSAATILVFLIYSVFGKQKNTHVIKKNTKINILQKLQLTPTDLAFCVFVFFILLSAVLSDYPNDVWYGAKARYHGAVTFFLYLAFYFCISRNLKGTRFFVICSVVSFCIVCTLGVLNCFGIDPIGFYSRIAQTYKTAYISTIGNVNFYSSYLCLLFPLVLCGFCMTRHRLSQIVYTAALIVGSFGMMVTSSESFVLGYFVSAAIIPLFLFNDLRQIKKYLLAFVIVLSSAQVFTWIHTNAPVANVPISQLLGLIVKPQLTIALLIVCVAVYLILQFFPQVAGPFRNMHIAFLILAFSAGVACFVLANTVGIGPLDVIFKVTENWGSYRGEIWQQCLSLFKDYSFKEKLFGIGPESLHRISDGNAIFAGKRLDQAHNEYLHYLMTSGICGAVSYIVLLGCVVRTMIRNIRNSTLAVGLFAGLVSYWIQATVNIAQPFSTPIMFTYIAVLCGIARPEYNQRKDEKK